MTENGIENKAPSLTNLFVATIRIHLLNVSITIVQAPNALCRVSSI